MNRGGIGGLLGLMTGLMLVCGAPGAFAQDNLLEGRLTLHASFGYQVSSEELRQRIDFRAYGEDAHLLATHGPKGGPLFDVGGLIEVWQALSVGASYAQTTGSDPTTLAGTVPHPLFAATDRTIPVQTAELTREERSTHIHLAWRIDLPVEKLDLRVMGGPSYFSLTQGIVTGVEVSEVGPPFTTVNIDRIASGDLIKNAWGGHAAVDITYMVSPNVGVGGFVRFAQGSTTLTLGAADVSVTVGGLHTGGGIRLRF